MLDLAPLGTERAWTNHSALLGVDAHICGYSLITMRQIGDPRGNRDERETDAAPARLARTQGVRNHWRVPLITLGLVILMKTAVLCTQGIEFRPWDISIVKALLLTKFILLGDAMKIGERTTTRPLIWPTLYMAFPFLMLLLIMTIIEEANVGLFVHPVDRRIARRRQAGADVYHRPRAARAEVRDAAVGCKCVRSEWPRGEEILASRKPIIVTPEVRW
jgi:hypothetical protein